MSPNIIILSCIIAVSTVCWGGYVCDQSQCAEIALNPRIQWAQSLLKQYPELMWLADDRVAMTQEFVAQPNSQALTPQLLEGRFCPELERTLLSLQVLQWLRENSSGAYGAMTAGQPAKDKLSWLAYENLSAIYKKVLSEVKYMNPNEIERALRVELVLGDIGKSQAARDYFKRYGIEAADHDDWIAQLLKNPEARKQLPSFGALSPEARALILRTDSLGHFGHMVQIEGSAAMYRPLKQSNILQTDEAAFEFKWLLQQCDVAGAGGHVTALSSVVYTQPVYQAYAWLHDAIMTLKEGTPEQAYNAYLELRANAVGISLSISDGGTVVRLAAMLRFMTPAEGAALKNAWSHLPNEIQQLARDYLSPAASERYPVTPTYFPAVLVNLLNNPQLGPDRLGRLPQVLELGITGLCRALREYEKLLNDRRWANVQTPLNVNTLAYYAKTDPFSLASPALRVDRITGEAAIVLKK